MTPIEQERTRAIMELWCEIDRLRTAIRTHRDKCGDDRCWIDDHELYAVLGEPFDTHTKNLPCREEFLTSCERYWRQRQPTGAPITEHPPDPKDMSDPSTLTIGQLERENVRLQAEVDYQIDYTKKRGNQMLLDFAEINRFKAEINRVSDAWLSAYIFETKREGTECHPGRRFRVVMPRGGDQWFATHDEAKEALLRAVMT